MALAALIKMRSEYDRGFIAPFRTLSGVWASAHPNLHCAWQMLADDEAFEFQVRGSEPGGFGVAIEVQRYGLYPLIEGMSIGWSWDVTTPGWSLEQMCNQALALVRATLCADCRLTLRLAAGVRYQAILESASANGWQPVERAFPVGLLRRWWLARSKDQQQEYLQNQQLPQVGFAAGTETWRHFVFEAGG